MTKICFIGNLSSTFIKKDYEILEKHFDVDVIEPPSTKSGWLKYPSRVAKEIRQSDISFSWFAGWHSAFPIHYTKKNNKKSIVVVGGYDCANIYGAFSKGRYLKEGLPAKYVFKNVDRILVVDSSLNNNIIRNAKIKGENIKCIPTGYEPNYWRPKGDKQRIVLTVASAKDLRRIKIKGLETFIKSAKYFSEKFVIVGIEGTARDYLEKLSTKNVEIVGFLSQSELLSYYQKSKVYCQLSIREGLPNVLCEAMLCGCLPIGTKRGGIPTAIGDTGFYVPYGNKEATVEAIKRALAAPDSLQRKTRQRISKLFPLKQREKALLEVIKDTLGEKP